MKRFNKKSKSNFNNPLPRTKVWGSGSGSPYDFMSSDKQLLREARGWSARRSFEDVPNMYGMMDAA